MTNAKKIHILEIRETYSFIVMVVGVKNSWGNTYEYYVRDRNDYFAFEFMFGVDGHNDNFIKSAINQFIELHKDEL